MAWSFSYRGHNWQNCDKVIVIWYSQGYTGFGCRAKVLKTLRDGNILSECCKKQHSTNLLRCTKFVEILVKIYPHRFLNTVKEVVRLRDLASTTQEDMLQNLLFQNVTAVHRIKTHRDDVVLPTNTFILTFGSPIVPASIKAGYLNVSEEQYASNSRRCFECQRFQHYQCLWEGCCLSAMCGGGTLQLWLLLQSKHMLSELSSGPLRVLSKMTNVAKE